jgi:hypothetical protein
MHRPARRDARSALRSAVAEVLEPRRLFAAIESGILVARGTANADTIALRRSGGDDVIVTTNGANQTFDMDDFTGVRLVGFGGNDTFNMIDALTSPVVRNTTVLGGDGNDTISYATRSTAIGFRMDVNDSTATSGAQVDHFVGVETVIGGGGNDQFVVSDNLGSFDEPVQLVRLEGRGGDDGFDDLRSGNDTFAAIDGFGGDGNDTFGSGEIGGTRFFGEAGNDRITTDESLQFFDGGSGLDTVEHAGENPTVDLSTDGPNVERLIAFPHTRTVIGNDLPNFIDASGGDSITVFGNGGDDTIVGSDGDGTSTSGADSLDGGEGNDSLIGGPAMTPSTAATAPTSATAARAPTRSSASRTRPVAPTRPRPPSPSAAACSSPTEQAARTPLPSAEPARTTSSSPSTPCRASSTWTTSPASASSASAATTCSTSTTRSAVRSSARRPSSAARAAIPSPMPTAPRQSPSTATASPTRRWMSLTSSSPAAARPIGSTTRLRR